ncbi:hypothetical protein Ahy_A09g043644 [Arachis hypogaea]|uniref:Zinc finger PMZ-type domain-containing protein n=1 Tax=Arachis hypogaea TaxID=3818 RepID=A0A445BIT2_ARAHY|nr:hypothetical protein Ahy_A09g043644 [Arachis hypogaea]
MVDDLVLQSLPHALERSVVNILKREIFLLFRPMLTKACGLKVSHYPSSSIFKCFCMRMELLDIPCDNVVIVLVHLYFTEISNSLFLARWSKNARSRDGASY